MNIIKSPYEILLRFKGGVISGIHCQHIYEDADNEMPTTVSDAIPIASTDDPLFKGIISDALVSADAEITRLKGELAAAKSEIRQRMIANGEDDPGEE